MVLDGVTVCFMSLDLEFALCLGLPASPLVLRKWLPRYRYAVRAGDDNPMLRTGAFCAMNLADLAEYDDKSDN